MFPTSPSKKSPLNNNRQFAPAGPTSKPLRGFVAAAVTVKPKNHYESRRNIRSVCSDDSLGASSQH